jgi:hypothetical protein
VTDLRDITFWIGVIAVATSLQTLLLVVMAIGVWRAYGRASMVLQGLQRDALTPAVTRLNTALDDAHELMHRVRVADDNVRRVMSTTGARAAHAASQVRSGFWPVVGLGRGVWAAVAAFTRR